MLPRRCSTTFRSGKPALQAPAFPPRRNDDSCQTLCRRREPDDDHHPTLTGGAVETEKIRPHKVQTCPPALFDLECNVSVMLDAMPPYFSHAGGVPPRASQREFAKGRPPMPSATRRHPCAPPPGPIPPLTASEAACPFANPSPLPAQTPPIQLVRPIIPITLPSAAKPTALGQPRPVTRRTVPVVSGPVRSLISPPISSEETSSGSTLRTLPNPLNRLKLSDRPNRPIPGLPKTRVAGSPPALSAVEVQVPLGVSPCAESSPTSAGRSANPS